MQYSVMCAVAEGSGFDSSLGLGTSTYILIPMLMMNREIIPGRK